LVEKGKGEMFQVEMLPAMRGDCLWIEYGTTAAPTRILIDGGLARTGRALRDRLLALPKDQRRFELVIISHIDLDHIGGILELLRDPPEGLQIDDLWFNAWPQLEAARQLVQHAGVLGPKQGEAVSYYVDKWSIPQNLAFGAGRPPIVRMPNESVPCVGLEGGMTVRILGPTPARLDALQPVWKKKIDELGLEPGQAGQVLEKADEKHEVPGVLGGGKLLDRLLAEPYKEDTSEANGSSIAVMLEYGGRRLLCTGDAFAEDLTEASDLLAREDGVSRLQVVAAKLSHHGGKKNTSVELVKKLRCTNWLVSTDGSTYGHPDGASLARVVRHANAASDPTLHFNYATTHNAAWRQKPLQSSEGFSASSPPDGEEGAMIDVAAL
jgi:beta-lactamase superfamily II metal-dependent hydrolase